MYKAKRIDDDSYLIHISRYIHMNPRRWLTYKYSSLRCIFDESPPKWLKPGIITSQFDDRQEYIEFLEDYQDNKDSLEEIKHQLAG